MLLERKQRNTQKIRLLLQNLALLTGYVKRNNSTIDEMKNEILVLNKLTFTEKQDVEFEGQKEERFRCYFVYSGNRGRCYLLNFNDNIKVITVFPLGRTTLKRYRKRFK